VKTRLITLVAKIDLQGIQRFAADVRKTARLHQMQGLMHGSPE
jgi:hypothetical protein